ncbi:ATP-binding protein [Arcobacter sp. YIC-80]|uniref:ATP-binding protein n=1 Tax=unclassified Arcobacter TaxID=2593671 RepID=UPI00384CA3D3
MKTLEACYEINFSKINFIERKIRVTHPKTIIKGAPKVGKSFLIYDYLSNFKTQEYIYIDFYDPRNDKEEIKIFLDEFLREKKIKVLVIENFDFSFDIPYCESIIISSNIDKKLKGFRYITVFPLDFEEYLLHDKKYQNTTQSFNNFLKYGNLPEISNFEEHRKAQRLQEIIKLQAKDDTHFRILNILFENIDEKKSLYQLFTTLKSKIKISKDKFYDTCKKLESENIVYFLSKYNQEKATKKIYSYNHSFLNVISHTKKFKNEFTNMIFLELIHKNKEIYYLDSIDFYLKNKSHAIVAIPFFNTFLMNATLKKIYKNMSENNIKELFIITISNTEIIKHKKFKINVLPFYEWALS